MKFCLFFLIRKTNKRLYQNSQRFSSRNVILIKPFPSLFIMISGHLYHPDIFDFMCLNIKTNFNAKTKNIEEVYSSYTSHV